VLREAKRLQIKKPILRKTGFFNLMISVSQIENVRFGEITFGVHLSFGPADTNQALPLAKLFLVSRPLISFYAILKMGDYRTALGVHPGCQCCK